MFVHRTVHTAAARMRKNQGFCCDFESPINDSRANRVWFIKRMRIRCGMESVWSTVSV